MKQLIHKVKDKLLISSDATLVHICGILSKYKNINELKFLYNDRNSFNYDLFYICANRFEMIIKLEISLYKLKEFFKECTKRDKSIFKRINLVIVIDDENFLQLKKIYSEPIEIKLQSLETKEKYVLEGKVWKPK